MTYCELWLEMREGSSKIRAVLLAPKEVEVPSGFERLLVDSHSGKILYITDWFDGIKKAKDSMTQAAEFYNEREIKYLFFTEIRRPTESESDAYI